MQSDRRCCAVRVFAQGYLCWVHPPGLYRCMGCTDAWAAVIVLQWLYSSKCTAVAVPIQTAVALRMHGLWAWGKA
jgi:hypothetical protein